jgi:hypothetical protein
VTARRAVALLALPAAAALAFAGARLAMDRRDAPFTVDDRLRLFGERCDALWRGRCAAAGLPYPPARVRFLALKAERRLEVHAATSSGPWRALADYPVLAASGGPGPKLREGDRQVPEGLYALPSLNLNSRFHVSIRVGYPSAEDVAQARVDGRTSLGGDIMIHGGAASIGCLAMGDPAAEELFTLAARTTADVLILPHDVRTGAPDPPGTSPWMAERYRRLRSLAAELRR